MALSGSKSIPHYREWTLSYHYRDQHSASGLDTSSYAEALPTLSLSPYQG